MKSHELVKALVDAAGGELPVAKAMGWPNFQGTLYKVAAGRVLSPKRETAERIAKHFGISVDAIYSDAAATEEARRLGILDVPSTGDLPTGLRETLAHAPSQPPFTVAHTTITWGDLVALERLPEQFILAMPDDSMGAAAPAGTLIWFEARSDARPPDWVLLTDDAGNWYIREYKERRPGHWEAHAAEGSGRLPLDSIRDGLQVKAIYVGQRGRKGGES